MSAECSLPFRQAQGRSGLFRAKPPPPGGGAEAAEGGTTDSAPSQPKSGVGSVVEAVIVAERLSEGMAEVVAL